MDCTKLHACTHLPSLETLYLFFEILPLFINSEELVNLSRSLCALLLPAVKSLLQANTTDLYLFLTTYPFCCFAVTFTDTDVYFCLISSVKALEISLGLELWDTCLCHKLMNDVITAASWSSWKIPQQCSPDRTTLHLSSKKPRAQAKHPWETL